MRIIIIIIAKDSNLLSIDAMASDSWQECFRYPPSEVFFHTLDILRILMQSFRPEYEKWMKNTHNT